MMTMSPNVHHDPDQSMGQMHPDELSAHSCLSFRTKSGKNYWSFLVSEECIDVLISGSINANSLSFLRSMAVAARGIIMIPKWMVRDELVKGQLVSVLDEFPLNLDGTPIDAVFSHNRHFRQRQEHSLIFSWNIWKDFEARDRQLNVSVGSKFAGHGAPITTARHSEAASHGTKRDNG